MSTPGYEQWGEMLVEEKPIVDSIEALCAEVLELRANAAAVLRADLGEDDVTEQAPFIDPEELERAKDTAARSDQ